MKMIAYHGEPKIKAKYLARVKAHEKADEIRKGFYWEEGKGCAVGCTIHGKDHGAYEAELGVPRILALLEDSIFENIPDYLAKTWPRRFLAAIKPGADLSLVWPQLAVWLLVDDEFGVLQFAKTEAQREAVHTAADLYLYLLEGAEVDRSDFIAAADLAEAAAPPGEGDAAYVAYSALYSAADLLDELTSPRAAYSAENSALHAALAAETAGKSTEWRIAQSEKLIELLKAAK